MILFHLSGNYMRRAVFSAVVLCSCIYADAASKNAEPTEDDIFEMSIAENVSTPVVPKKNMAAIVDKQKREAKRLKEPKVYFCLIVLNYAKVQVIFCVRLLRCLLNPGCGKC